PSTQYPSTYPVPKYRRYARVCAWCASAVQFVGRFGPLTVITYVITASSIPAAGGGGYARYLGEQDRRARARRLLPDPGRGDDAGPWPVARGPGDAGSAGGAGRRAGRRC